MNIPSIQKFGKGISILEAFRSCGRHILGETPCSLKKVYQILSASGYNDFKLSTVVDVFRGLSFRYPHNFIIENEGQAGYFLVYFDMGFLEQLQDQKPMSLSTDPNTLGLEKADEVLSLRIPESNNLLDDFESIFKESTPYMSSLLDEIRKLTVLPTALENERAENVKSDTTELPVVEFCKSYSLKACQQMPGNNCLNKIHFQRIVDYRNERNVDDCSYLDTCFKGKQCRFAHYRIRQPSIRAPRPKIKHKSKRLCQQINADIKSMDLSKLGNSYDALIIDPPWDIHTNPKSKNSGCTDQDVMKLRIDKLQTDGIIFLWVTGRLLEFGRQCLRKWGYDDIEELVWIKTNQLNRTICTGRTGHWINHTKEHVLFARKGNTKHISSFIDCDVMVSITQGQSKKPRELYGIVDRMVGVDSKKLELFGRSSNVRQGWVTVGNELGFTRLHDTLLKLNIGKI